MLPQQFLGIFRIFCAVLFIGASFVLPGCAADAPNFPTNEDLRHFRSLNDPRLAPDGRSVLIRIIDATADGGKSHLWLVDIQSNSSRQLTYSPDSDKTGESKAEWMPDGSGILFLAHRTQETQLYRLPMNGGEAKAFDIKVMPMSDASKFPNAIPPPSEAEKKSPDKKEDKAEPLALDIESFDIAPDGKQIAIIAKDPKPPGEKKQTDAKADATWVDHELHGTRVYLFEPASGKITPVAIPPDVRAVAWSHDSSRLLVTEEETNGIADLRAAASGWLVTVRDPAHPAKLAELPDTLEGASWSADDSALVFLAQAQQDAPPGYRDLFECNLAAHSVRNLSDRFSGSVGFQEPITLDGGVIVQDVSMGVRTAAARFTPAQAKPEVFSFETPIAGSFHTNHKLTGWVFLGSGSTQPATLYYTADLAQPARALSTPSLTPANGRSVPAKRIQWKSDKRTIEGLLYLPPQAAQGRVPLIVQVHGGPLGAYEDTYVPFVNFLVGHGWAVLRTNPRGSTNYGVEFAAANKNDLGGGDYRDIMAGVDYVLKMEPIDANRLALEGYSYGGEMAGFVEGKTSRFKAIVSGAPVIDQYSEYGTESFSRYDRWYFGKPWEHPADAWRQSPLSGAGHATTPFLLLQGEADTTDPLGQSQEMYRALRQMGVSVELVTYPRENHGPLARGIYGAPTQEPWHGFDGRQRIVEFFEKAFGSAAK